MAHSGAIECQLRFAVFIAGVCGVRSNMTLLATNIQTHERARIKKIAWDCIR